MNDREIKAAGAPELPFGFFYRSDEMAYGFYRVEIRELGEHYGSHVIAKALSYPHETMADLAEVSRRAVTRMPRSGS